jgi:hypothetical protein
MTRTPKLNDLQLVLLTTAAQRADGSLLPPSETLGEQAARIRKVLPPLITRALIAERDVTDAARAWRSDGDRYIGVFITDAGRAIIGAEQDGEAAAAAGPLLPSKSAPPAIIAAVSKPASKIAQVLTLLGRDDGATLDELVAATGWLPHTTRAALTGLRKKGRTLTKTKRGDATCYHIAEAA